MYISYKFRFKYVNVRSIWILKYWVGDWLWKIHLSPKFKTEDLIKPGIGPSTKYQYFTRSYLVSLCFLVFKFLKSKCTQIFRPQKGNSRISFTGTVSNFRLWIGVLLNTIFFHLLISFKQEKLYFLILNLLLKL